MLHLNITTRAQARGLRVCAVGRPPRGGSSGGGNRKQEKGRWRGMDADMDMSDDQQDIARGRDMVDSLFQGFGAGAGGTHNAIMSTQDYLSTAQRYARR